MSVKFDTIIAGDRLFDVRRPSRRERLWDSKSKWIWWTLEVLEVDTVNDRALISWNTNRPEWKPASYFAQPSIRRKLPKEKESTDR